MQLEVKGENEELRDIVEGLISEIRVIGRGEWFNNYFLFCNVDYSIKSWKLPTSINPARRSSKPLKNINNLSTVNNPKYSISSIPSTTGIPPQNQPTNPKPTPSHKNPQKWVCTSNTHLFLRNSKEWRWARWLSCFCRSWRSTRGRGRGGWPLIGLWRWWRRKLWSSRGRWPGRGSRSPSCAWPRAPISTE